MKEIEIQRERKSGREWAKWSDREIWRPTATNLLFGWFYAAAVPLPCPPPAALSTAPLPTAAVKIYLSYKFCEAALKKERERGRESRTERQSQSGVRKTFNYFISLPCTVLANSLCTEMKTVPNSRNWDELKWLTKFVFCALSSLPNLYIVAAVVSLSCSFFLSHTLCCEKL